MAADQLTAAVTAYMTSALELPEMKPARSVLVRNQAASTAEARATRSERVRF